MDSLRAALTWVKDLLDWLPDPVVALLILAVAVLVALALHRWARKLVRQAFGERYPYIFSVFTQTRGLTRLALLILAMIVAIPVAPLQPETAAFLARLMAVAVIALIGWGPSSPCTLPLTFICGASASTSTTTCWLASTTRRCAFSRAQSMCCL